MAALVAVLSLPVHSSRAQAEATATASAEIQEGATETATPTPSETDVPPAPPQPLLSEAEASPEVEAPIEGSEYVPDEILVQLNPNASPARVLDRIEAYGEVYETELAVIGVYVLKVSDGNMTNEIAQVRNLAGVAHVEPNYYVHAADTFPNDPSFGSQYALIAIRAPQGWDLSTGSTSVTIAVLDSGVDLTHPDLAAKVVPGYDFVNNDAVPQDDYGHGTHVAGIAAAASNNGAGIAGVSWGARVMPVKVLNSAGNGTYADVATGVIWAADNGAQIINMSLGGSSYSAVLDSAISYAVNGGLLVIAAAGNTNSNLVLYPARDADVMGVAATDSSNQRASFSNYGPEIDIAAPGASIYSLYTGGGYNTLSGTSMSAPHVAGLAAILFGFDANPGTVRNVIESTALDIDAAGVDIYTGAGLIQMDAAIAQVAPPPTPTPTPTSTPTPTAASAPGSVFGGSYLPAVISTSTFAPTWTPVPATDTPTPTATPGAPATATASAAPTTTPIPTPSGLARRLSVLWSAPFCLGTVLLVLGLLFFWRERRRPPRGVTKSLWSALWKGKRRLGRR